MHQHTVTHPSSNRAWCEVIWDKFVAFQRHSQSSRETVQKCVKIFTFLPCQILAGDVRQISDPIL